MKPFNGFKDGSIAIFAAVAAAAALPAVHVVKKLKRRWDIKHLPVHVLRGPDGMEAHISPLGAVIQRFLVPDARGILADIVLGFDDMEPYAVRSSRPRPCVSNVTGFWRSIYLRVE
jgi:hypothetical protein